MKRSIVPGNVSVLEVVVTNAAIVGLAATLEHVTWFSRGQRLRLIYDDMERVRGSKEDLIEDLRARTGLSIERVSVDEIDLLRDTARLTLHVHREG